MAPPTPLAIATSSTRRLVKEEASYHKELQSQEARLAKLEADKDEDENAEYQLKQERRAIEETRAVFPPLRIRITDALHKLEDLLEGAQGNGVGEEEVRAAKETIQQAKDALSQK
ncbi:uncharacterized protein BP5553_10566 [Venustampulla echinocandica]|uniref:Tubulin-specific chaperone A n=1 Tax=Venustampulla echinocandica TaxID=2656787 RepID=A0A370T8X8_9HELO|nr:uncharacterized protein BP5553_10566 [Venustampulla echinocandica]RDL29939.1 hypothetical protein BP5553_10566 [Venustampulla echinocandica]